MNLENGKQSKKNQISFYLTRFPRFPLGPFSPCGPKMN